MAVDKVLVKLVLDFIILAGVGLVLLSTSLWVDPFHKGYFEDDHSLRLPFKEQSIPEAALGITAFLLNLITIIIVELIRDRKEKGVGDKYLSGFLIPGWVWQAYTTMGIFTFGAACQQLTAEFTKAVTGSLRPNFFDVCRPVPNATSPMNAFGYIQDYSCAGTDDRKILKDMRLSFPSAHASFAMYSAVFFMLYIQVKGKWRGSKLLRHVVQYTALMAAWYVGLTRVMEHIHHWGDVAAGFLLGASYAVVTFVYILKPKKYGVPNQHQTPQRVNSLPKPVAPRSR